MGTSQSPPGGAREEQHYGIIHVDGAGADQASAGQDSAGSLALVGAGGIPFCPHGAVDHRDRPLFLPISIKFTDHLELEPVTKRT